MADDAPTEPPRDALFAIRKRPGMYVGDLTDGSGMHQLVWSTLAEAVHERLLGHASTLEIAIAGERITIEDDGRGLPADTLQQDMTSLGGGLFWPPYRVRREPARLGLPIVNALASDLELASFCDGRTHVQRYAQGRPLGPVEPGARTSRTGVRVSFVPDFTIFTRRAWEPERIARRCRELAALLPDFTLELDGTVYRYASLVEYLCDGRGELVAPLHVRETVDGVTVELAIAHHHGATAIEGFVNYERADDGTHVRSLRDAIHSALARRFEGRIARERTERGLLAVVHVILQDPQFEGQGREFLRNIDAGRAVHVVVERALARHFEEAPPFLDAMLQLMR